MSHRSQIIILIWALLFMYITGFALWGLLHMLPPPDANWTAEQVAAFYRENSMDIRLGAMVASWTSAFMVPFSAMVYIQMRRLEKGLPVWSIPGRIRLRRRRGPAVLRRSPQNPPRSQVSQPPLAGSCAPSSLCCWVPVAAAGVEAVPAEARDREARGSAGSSTAD